MANPQIRDVKSSFGNALTDQLAAFASNPANGDCIVVIYGVYHHTTAHLAPVDTAGNTYIQIGTTLIHTSSGNANSMWLAKNIVGGATFRVTCKPNNTYYAVEAWALSAVDIDPYNSDFSKFTPVIATTIARSGVSSPAPAPNSIFIGGCSVGGSQTLTDQAGWNTTGANGFTAGMLSAARVNQYASFFDLWGAYKISSTVEEAQWSAAGNDTDKGGIVASFSGPRLSLTSVDPTSGTSVGGTPVTLTGLGFTVTPSSVTFGGTAATSIVRVSDTSVTCVTPAHAAGLVDVVVTVSGNSSTLVGAYTFVKPPTVLVPSTVIVGVVYDVYVSSPGDIFTGSTTAAFSGTGVTVNSVTFIDATHLKIRITVAANATPGARDLTLTTP